MRFSLLLPSIAGLLLASPVARSEPLVSGPWLQRVTEDEAWVLWEGAEGAVVSWGPGGGGQQQEAAASERSGEVWHARLAPLQPGQGYTYRLIHSEGETDSYDFEAADHGAGLRLIVVSDTQHDSGNPERWLRTVEEGIEPWAREHWGGEPEQVIDLVLVVGDLVQDGWEEDQWRHDFIGPAQGLMARVPFYAAIGNHEANSNLYFDRFHLPQDGSEAYPEHWWLLDRGGLRLIGLDSNPPYTGQTQQDWLAERLEEACGDPDIHFVITALHHPWQSELWPPGESAFTGVIIEQLDAFSQACDKPSAHLFGHTHGYSRGQSRDARQLWVNVATASGDIDEWGEYDQVDYDSFEISLAEYGFVAIEIQGGEAPALELLRVGLGDAHGATEPLERDRVRLLRDPTVPATPEARSPAEEVSPHCIQLAASPYCDPDDEAQGASHWQIASDCAGFDEPSVDAWVQHRDLYMGEDLQEGDHLGDLLVLGLEPEASWCWRVRHRDQGLAWSAWSEPTAFSTGASSLSDNLLRNPGGEEGTEGWEADGPLEALEAGACDGTEPFSGAAYLAVGGLCEDGVDSAEAWQDLDLGPWSEEVDAGALAVLFGGRTRSYGEDRAELELRWLDADGSSLGGSARLGGASEAWEEQRAVEAVPPGTRTVRFVLLGTRLAGEDCDAYFDELQLRLDSEGALARCLEAPEYPWSDETPSCEEEPADPGDSGDPRRGCGCHAGRRAAALPLLALALILGARRKERYTAGADMENKRNER
jgi:hypothetical protein